VLARRSSISAALLACLLTSRLAQANDVGEISLISDDGTIISNAFLFDLFVAHAACAFYKSHSDDYDALFVFTSADLNALTRTPQGWPTHSPGKGMGFDYGLDLRSSFCAMRLRQAIKMGDIGSFDDDPDALYTGAPGATFTGAEVMAHEFGHQFMAAVGFEATDGIPHCMDRGFAMSSDGMSGSTSGPTCDGYDVSDFNLHWSYYFNTGPSPMYGNHIEDLGGGNFALTNPGAKYSPLDQYLMGLRDPSDVPPMFMVDVGELTSQSAAFPVVRGSTVTISGTRVDFTIDDVIRSEGPRVPARDMCHWKAAFVIVYPPATPPTAAQIALVDRYRQRWETFYDWATDHRGSFDTTLSGTGLGTPTCPAPGAPPPPDAGTSSDASWPDNGPPAGDAAVAPSDATTLDASAIPAPAMSSDASSDANIGGHTLRADGCACGTTDGGSPVSLLLALAAAFVLGRRRR
jgi:MYXO-CTERM domain-containing protein